MITITNDHGQQIHIAITESYVYVYLNGSHIYFSLDDARELRRFLEALG